MLMIMLIMKLKLLSTTFIVNWQNWFWILWNKGICLPILSFMVCAGAAVDGRGEHNETGLMQAVQHGHMDTVITLLEVSVLLSRKEKKGFRHFGGWKSTLRLIHEHDYILEGGTFYSSDRSFKRKSKTIKKIQKKGSSVFAFSVFLSVCVSVCVCLSVCGL